MKIIKKINQNVTTRLENSSVFVFCAYAIIAAFMTYFCMYGFRKPYTAAKFTDLSIWGIDFKIALIISQLIGYALSKCLGVKIVSEMKANYRAWGLVLMITWAEAALFLFAVVDNPTIRVVALFLNGIPLGMVWGLVFSYLEGRQTSELLGAGLSCSYIIASGAVKTVGALWLENGVSQYWMPFVTGLCFFPVFILSLWALSLMPAPSAEDERQRTKRAPMNSKERREFIKMFFPGLLFLTILYFFLTAYRGVRDDFAAEIWSGLGYGAEPLIFTQAELPIPFVVMIFLALLYLVKNNRIGLFVTHYIMLAGTLLIGISTLLYDFQVINGAVWMILVGLGLYLAYVPYGCVLFDRLIAAFGVTATAVFMIYVTDAVGYIGTIAINLYKNFSYNEMSMLSFFRYFSYITSVLCSACFIASLVYFMYFAKDRHKKE
ncbi:DUF5690 family protein [Candidatus Uabimicrobium amorphum]|uniref:MFS transporter n=1 Tax=Uabimicrobium amorphum TaxID=2596890 RepID=A0A5S9ILE1_UABAM|nr:DUF5690 family protein [Candidatus Uabimicrobium amorphum]BBM83864.1 hypothetical protein UABAM_02219 [Candidatus Uabimicrobium amorphum]